MKCVVALSAMAKGKKDPLNYRGIGEDRHQYNRPNQPSLVEDAQEHSQK